MTQDTEDVMCDGNGECFRQAQEIARLRTEVEQLRQFAQAVLAVEAEHNGCDPDGCCAAEDLTAAVAKFPDVARALQTENEQ